MLCFPFILFGNTTINPEFSIAALPEVFVSDAWFSRRQAPKSDEAIGIRLTRIERNTEWLRRNQVRARIVRHQFIAGAMHPVSEAAQAKGAKLFAQLIDEIADRFAGKGPPTTDDPATQKLRTLQ